MLVLLLLPVAGGRRTVQLYTSGLPRTVLLATSRGSDHQKDSNTGAGNLPARICTMSGRQQPLIKDNHWCHYCGSIAAHIARKCVKEVAAASD
jgi:hypothetical protein